MAQPQIRLLLPLPGFINAHAAQSLFFTAMNYHKLRVAQTSVIYLRSGSGRWRGAMAALQRGGMMFVRTLPHHQSACSWSTTPAPWPGGGSAASHPHISHLHSATRASHELGSVWKLSSLRLFSPLVPLSTIPLLLWHHSLCLPLPLPLFLSNLSVNLLVLSP